MNGAVIASVSKLFAASFVAIVVIAVFILFIIIVNVVSRVG